jgi:hypothetical protein
VLALNGFCDEINDVEFSHDQPPKRVHQRLRGTQQIAAIKPFQR